MMRSEERANRSNKRGPRSACPPALLRLHPIRRPRDGTSCPVGAQQRPGPAPHIATARGAALQRKGVPSIHMRCSTMASLRARATQAFFNPCRLATRNAQAFSAEKRAVRVSSTSPPSAAL